MNSKKKLWEDKIYFLKEDIQKCLAQIEHNKKLIEKYKQQIKDLK